jgi:hypothetical protein
MLDGIVGTDTDMAKPELDERAAGFSFRGAGQGYSGQQTSLLTGHSGGRR